MNHPTFSYKDRVVSVAATRAVELGFDVFACASTGNLANSVAAHAARLGLDVLRLHPRQPEAAKVLGLGHLPPARRRRRGNYDDVNRLCTQIADRHGWGFANINLRTYYAEGAKTYGFEIAEQLGWRFPRHVVCPVAGGTLLPRIARAFEELRDARAGCRWRLPRMHAVQAAGSSPVINALEAGAGVPRAGEAADDRQVDRDRQSGRRLSTCWRRCARPEAPAPRSSDEQILDAQPSCSPRRKACSPSLPAARRSPGRLQLIKNGVIPRDESVVVCITGNGYKTADVMAGRTAEPTYIGRSFAEFESYFAAVGG